MFACIDALFFFEERPESGSWVASYRFYLHSASHLQQSHLPAAFTFFCTELHASDRCTQWKFDTFFNTFPSLRHTKGEVISGTFIIRLQKRCNFHHENLHDLDYYEIFLESLFIAFSQNCTILQVGIVFNALMPSLWKVKISAHRPKKIQ